MKWLLPFIAALNLLTFALYYFDKRAAIRGDPRTPENTLHVLALLGGWPGAFLAQRIFRHKSRKRQFQIIFWTCVAINLLIVFWASKLAD
jgi:uncharacterized membrane protein YsdA (DUF1294 family)